MTKSERLRARLLETLPEAMRCGCAGCALTRRQVADALHGGDLTRRVTRAALGGDLAGAEAAICGALPDADLEAVSAEMERCGCGPCRANRDLRDDPATASDLAREAGEAGGLPDGARRAAAATLLRGAAERS